MKQHMEVARAALAEERAASGKRSDSRRKRRELEFLPAVLEVTETPPSPLGRVLSLTLIAFFALAIAWTIIGHVDIIATAQGKIIPSERVKVIQPRDTGVVSAIHVSDGQKVKRGDLLVELDPTDTEADRDRLRMDAATARVEIARMQALLTDQPEKVFAAPPGTPETLVALHRSYLMSQVREYRSRQAAIESEVTKRKAEIETIKAGIARTEKILPSMRERVESRRQLVERQFAARNSFTELQEQLYDQEGQLAIQKQKLEEARAGLAAAESQREHVEAEFRRDVMAKLSEVRQRSASIDQETIKAEERSRLQTLTAPADGTVQQMAIHTVGGVATSAQPLLVIVPAGAYLEIEAMVLNKDVGFVHKGHEAEIKVESFPFTKYGTIAGRVLYVSADAVEDKATGLAYPARISLDRTVMRVDEKDVNLSSGMAVTVEIKTGQRRIIEYLLAPLQRYQKESLKER